MLNGYNTVVMEKDIHASSEDMQINILGQISQWNWQQGQVSVMLFLNKESMVCIYPPIILGRHAEVFILRETVDLWKDQILKASL